MFSPHRSMRIRNEGDGGNEDITDKLEITDKNTIIKHQLSLFFYYSLILNCDYFEYKH